MGSFGATLYKNLTEFANSFTSGSSDFGSTVASGAEKFAGKASEFASGFASKASEFAGEVAKGFEASMDRYEGKKNSSRSSEPEEAAQPEEKAQPEEELQPEEEKQTGEEAVAEEAGGDFDSIEIEAGCADVYLERSKDGTVRFNYTNNGTKNQQMAYRFYQEQKGSTLYAGVKNVGSTGFFKRVCPPEIKLVVEVPEGLKLVHVRTISGEIKSSKLNINILKCDCTSGDLSIDDNDLTELTIQSASGDVKVFESGIGACRIHTASGDVDINNTDAEGVMIDVASGDINVSGTVRKVSAKSASGDINLSCVKASEIAASAIAGDISVKLKLCDNGYTANINTISGDCELSYGDEKVSSSKKGLYTLGNGETRLNLSTVSGDIEVHA